MPTYRKTSLSIVCFYTLFFITSCVNPKKNKITFRNQDEETQAEIVVMDRSETAAHIQLTCLSKAKNIAINQVSLVCLNVNPMGFNAMEAANNNDLVQVYDANYHGNKIRIVLPYGNLEKNNRTVVLRIVTPRQAKLEMKLSSTKTHLGE